MALIGPNRVPIGVSSGPNGSIVVPTGFIVFSEKFGLPFEGLTVRHGQSDNSAWSTERHCCALQTGVYKTGF